MTRGIECRLYSLFFPSHLHHIVASLFILHFPLRSYFLIYLFFFFWPLLVLYIFPFVYLLFSALFRLLTLIFFLLFIFSSVSPFSSPLVSFPFFLSSLHSISSFSFSFPPLPYSFSLYNSIPHFLDFLHLFLFLSFSTYFFYLIRSPFSLLLFCFPLFTFFPYSHFHLTVLATSTFFNSLSIYLLRSPFFYFINKLRFYYFPVSNILYFFFSFRLSLFLYFFSFLLRSTSLLLFLIAFLRSYLFFCSFFSLLFSSSPKPFLSFFPTPLPSSLSPLFTCPPSSSVYFLFHPTVISNLTIERLECFIVKKKSWKIRGK